MTFVKSWLPLIILVLVLGSTTGGCTDVPTPPGRPSTGETVMVTTTVTGPSPQAGEPQVLILAPDFDGGILAGNVTIVVQVTRFTLTPPGGPKAPGTGHLIYYRDVVPPVAPGQPAVTAPGTSVASLSDTLTWEDVTPGTHTFAVQLVQADNTPLRPPVLDAIDVTAVLPEAIAVG